MMMSWCLMSSDVIWHIRDKLWPMPKHGSIILYVHGNQKSRQYGQPRMSTSTLTQLLNYDRLTPSTVSALNIGDLGCVCFARALRSSLQQIRRFTLLGVALLSSMKLTEKNRFSSTLSLFSAYRVPSVRLGSPLSYDNVQWSQRFDILSCV